MVCFAVVIAQPTEMGRGTLMALQVMKAHGCTNQGKQPFPPHCLQIVAGVSHDPAKTSQIMRQSSSLSSDQLLAADMRFSKQLDHLQGRHIHARHRLPQTTVQNLQ